MYEQTRGRAWLHMSSRGTRAFVSAAAAGEAGDDREKEREDTTLHAYVKDANVVKGRSFDITSLKADAASDLRASIERCRATLPFRVVARAEWEKWIGREEAKKAGEGSMEA